MAGKPMGSTTGLYPALAIVLGGVLVLGGSAFFVSRLTQASSEQADSDSLPPSSLPASPIPSIPSPASAASPSPTPIAQKVSPAAASVRLGTLRVSNPTDYPVRVALLSRGGVGKSGSDYDRPAHWDFAPQEGSAQGLVVGLPNRTLKIRPGDVLVAFAQDGSRRYWGPYVVGETPLPVWNAKAGEWQLTLNPF